MNEQILDLASVQVDPSCLLRVSAEFARQHRVLPLCILDGDLQVAMANPSDVRAVAELRRALGVPVIAHRVDPVALERMLGKLYGGVSAILSVAWQDDAVSTVDYLMRVGYLRHASDIHFDSDQQGMRVRYRVDGCLEDVMRIPPERQPSIVSRLKVLANLKLDERRAPQDGAFAWQIPPEMAQGSDALDVRLATLPGHFGEKVTLRLLETNPTHQDLNALGMDASDLAAFEDVLGCPHGMMLLTGPTGSGKTTTLYAAIHRLLSGPDLNIVTVENPVEYLIPGIFQAEVDGADKVNFTKALRSILRHDPDVIMIGEIRDPESLDTAVKAALTGHLVLSTLHTNDSINAVTRLANMGLERHLIAATLRLAVAQRLVRALCPNCHTCHAATPEESALLGDPNLQGATLYAPGGCLACAGRGFRGRMGLFELFRPDSETAEAIAEGATEGALRRLHAARGGKMLRDDGRAKCLAGYTTAYEVGRVA